MALIRTMAGGIAKVFQGIQGIFSVLREKDRYSIHVETA